MDEVLISSHTLVFIQVQLSLTFLNRIIDVIVG